jgi:hypothetical protein
MQQATTGSIWDLTWRIRLSALYHLKRERFLDGADRAAKAISALGGAAALSQLKSDPVFGMWMAGIITVVSTLSLVYSPSTKARRHAELARDFKKLEAELGAQGPGLSETDLGKLNARYLSIEAGEPAAMGALVTQCHNELSAAIGHHEGITPLPFLQRVFKNWFDFDQTPAKA